MTTDSALRGASSAAPTGERRGLPSIETALFVGLAILGAAAFACRAVQSLSPSLDVAGLERNVVFGVSRLLRGEALYSNPEQPPFAIIQYGPVYYWLLAGLCRLLGIGADRVEAIFLCGRLLSLAAMTGTATLLAWALPSGTSLLRRVATAGLVLCFFTAEYHACRPDALKGLLVTATVVLAVRGGRAQQWVLPCALVAVLTKQDAVWLLALPTVIACVGGFHKKEIVRSLASGAACFAFLAVLVALFPQLRQNAVLGVSNPPDPAWFWEWIIKRGFGANMGVAVALAGIVIAARSKLERPLIAAASAAIALAAGTVLGLKWGSGPNYLSDGVALGAFCFMYMGASSQRSKERALVRDGEAGLGLLCVAVYAAVAAVVASPDLMRGTLKALGEWRSARAESVAARTLASSVGAQLRDHDAYLLTNDDRLALLLPGRALFPQRDIVWDFGDARTNRMGVLARGTFSFRAYEALVAEGRVELVLKQDTPLPKSFAKADLGSCVLDDDRGDRRVFRCTRSSASGPRLGARP